MPLPSGQPGAKTFITAQGRERAGHGPRERGDALLPPPSSREACDMQEGGGVTDDEAGAPAVESLAAGQSQFQRYTGHSFDAPPVLFTKTVVRAAVRKALVRVRGAGGERIVVCCKDNALEVLRDTGDGLQLLFEECVFGAVWALQALPLDVLATRPRQALPPWLPHGGCDQVCSLAALCPTLRPWPCAQGLRVQGCRAGAPHLAPSVPASLPCSRDRALPCLQDLLIATSESGSLSVLQIDVARRRMRCIEQVCLPATSVFPDLWAGQTHAHLEPRRLYGRYLRVDSSGAAVAVASLDGKVAILPVQLGGEHDRLFAAADSADMLPSRSSAPPTARVVECACEHVTGIVADLAFVQLGAQSPRVGAAPTSPAALLYLAVLLLLEGKVTQKCFPRDVLCLHFFAYVAGRTHQCGLCVCARACTQRCVRASHFAFVHHCA